MFVTSFAAAGAAGYFTGANNTRTRLTKALNISVKSSTDTASILGDAPKEKIEVETEAVSTNADVAESNENQDTYIIKKGQTLYSIGKEVGIEWPALAAVNGLTEQSVLKEGQVIKIPTKTEAKTVQAREYKVISNDEEKTNLESAQTYADAGTGQLSYRMVPAQVVQRSPLLSRFGFTTHDLYIEKTKDTEKGEATVEVTQNGKLFTIFLRAYQKDKNEKTVWTPTRVTY